MNIKIVGLIFLLFSSFLRASEENESKFSYILSNEDVTEVLLYNALVEMTKKNKEIEDFFYSVLG